ncbi:hypothetical protein L6452_09455 [Arctium lappa]|uniref:Uncharacterized protein n=1 Tax=Arctium lappa TaxID=4217 RepID=A0ACB9DKL3_ARCLA|nr:hypothetical protein L6452_09455 [Arctium lappa]
MYGERWWSEFTERGVVEFTLDRGCGVHGDRGCGGITVADEVGDGSQRREGRWPTRFSSGEEEGNEGEGPR